MQVAFRGSTLICSAAHTCQIMRNDVSPSIDLVDRTNLIWKRLRQYRICPGEIQAPKEPVVTMQTSIPYRKLFRKDPKQPSAGKSSSSCWQKSPSP